MNGSRVDFKIEDGFYACTSQSVSLTLTVVAFETSNYNETKVELHVMVEFR